MVYGVAWLPTKSPQFNWITFRLDFEHKQISKNLTSKPPPPPLIWSRGQLLMSARSWFSSLLSVYSIFGLISRFNITWETGHEISLDVRFPGNLLMFKMKSKSNPVELRWLCWQSCHTIHHIKSTSMGYQEVKGFLDGGGPYRHRSFRRVQNQVMLENPCRIWTVRRMVLGHQNHSPSCPMVVDWRENRFLEFLHLTGSCTGWRHYVELIKMWQAISC